jgi:L-amino acid N-acyltransferase YncA
MPVHISDPRTEECGLDNLAPLWKELHRHHRDVSEYQALVQEDVASWERRLKLYRRLLDEGAAYLMVSDDDGRLLGYAMVAFEHDPDDTFEAPRGTMGASAATTA